VALCDNDVDLVRDKRRDNLQKLSAKAKSPVRRLGFLLETYLVPERGIEPPTFALRMRCSTV
jgi:hypothetical protein